MTLAVVMGGRVLGLDSRHGNLGESKEPPKVSPKARVKLEGKGRETETTGRRLVWKTVLRLTHAEEGVCHVGRHLLIIQRGNAYKALDSRHLRALIMRQGDVADRLQHKAAESSALTPFPGSGLPYLRGSHPVQPLNCSCR